MCNVEFLNASIDPVQGILKNLYINSLLRQIKGSKRKIIYCLSTKGKLNPIKRKKSKRKSTSTANEIKKYFLSCDDYFISYFASYFAANSFHFLSLLKNFFFCWSKIIINFFLL